MELLIILIVLSILFIITQLFKKNKRNSDTFSSTFTHKTNKNIYDTFYASIYDYLVYNSAKTDYEVKELERLTNITKNSVVLDVGCGTGHRTAELIKKKSSANSSTHSSTDSSAKSSAISGIDISPAMINQCVKIYPDLKNHFMVADALDRNVFHSSKFSHILCLYFTFYEWNDGEQRRFVENCMKWLSPGGILVIHLVNRDLFDPILPLSNPLLFVSPQKYAKERITNSKLHFKDFDYEAKYVPNKANTHVFKEYFKVKNGNTYRKHEHELYMPTIDDSVAMITDYGFIMEGIIDLIQCQYEYQYLYIFRKPDN